MNQEVLFFWANFANFDCTNVVCFCLPNHVIQIDVFALMYLNEGCRILVQKNRNRGSCNEQIP